MATLLKLRGRRSIVPGGNIQSTSGLRAWIATTCVRSELIKTVPEQTVPIEGQVKGNIPKWLNGKLIRNGPGLFEIGDTKVNHWFDGMAMLHRFNIQSGKVTYSSKFLRSDTYNQSMAANRLVVSQYGTYAVPDPCKTLFQRVQSYFSGLTTFTRGISDNCMINIFPVGDKYVAATESDFVHVFSPDTLESEEKVQLSKHISVLNATAHPHIDKDGTVYNLGASKDGYAIIKMPPVRKDEPLMKNASVLCNIPVKNKMKPSYNHAFSMTDNYFVLTEQSVYIDVGKIFRNKLLNRPVSGKDLICVDNTEQIRFFVVERKTGNVLPGKFLAPPGIIFHYINAYEDNGHIVLDGCSYDCVPVYKFFWLQEMNDGSSDYLTEKFKAEPRRYVLPIAEELQNHSKENMLTLDYTKATTTPQADGSIMCHHEILSEKGFELPQINYKGYNTKPYKFAYGLNQGFTEIIKADVTTKKYLSWSEENCSVSEPVFVGNPDSSKEDDGVLLSAVLYEDDSQPPFLLVLDARTMTEMGRAEFPEIQLTKDVHGQFVATE